MLDPFLSHELAVGRDHRGQRVVLVRVERDIFHRRRLLSRLNTAECLPRTPYPRRARRHSAYIPSTGHKGEPLSAYTRCSSTTAKTCHSPGTPFSWCWPRSLNANPEPTTRSLTVLETKTSPGPASAETRAPMCTAIPATDSPMTSHSPVWTPMRTSTPRS